MTNERWPLWYCPFLDEVDKKGRLVKKPKPCSMKYRVTCGCKNNQVPSPFRKWKRTGEGY